MTNTLPQLRWVTLGHGRWPDGASLPVWLCVALATLLLWQCISLALRWFEHEPPASVARRPHAMAVPIAADYDIATITDAHLFGELNPAGPTLPTQPPLPTTLDLQLKGTIAAHDAFKARAIIAAGGRIESVYALHDRVTPDATLHAVERTHVILNQRGHLTTLQLAHAQHSDVTTASQPRLADRVLAITDVIWPQRAIRDGRQVGYRLYPGRDRQRFAALGLRPGDVVTAVNGRSLAGNATRVDVLRALTAAESITVVVERNGQPVSLTLLADAHPRINDTER
ncbi:MAG: type II secretion system protein N [Pseudomonadota bacterium]